MTDIQVLYSGPVVKRDDARACGDKRYFTNVPCKHGHIDQRYAVSGACVTCNSIKCRKFRMLNPNYRAEYAKNNVIAPPSNEARKRWRMENRERHNAAGSNWRARNPNYAREWRAANKGLVASYASKREAAMGTHADQDVRDMLANQNNRCAEPTCRADFAETGYHVDHIMPLALGGTNWPDNLQCLCPSCNLRKHAKHPIDWAQENGRLL